MYKIWFCSCPPFAFIYANIGSHVVSTSFSCEGIIIIKSGLTCLVVLYKDSWCKANAVCSNVPVHTKALPFHSVWCFGDLVHDHQAPSSTRVNWQQITMAFVIFSISYSLQSSCLFYYWIILLWPLSNVSLNGLHTKHTVKRKLLSLKLCFSFRRLSLNSELFILFFFSNLPWHWCTDTQLTTREPVKPSKLLT